MLAPYITAKAKNRIDWKARLEPFQKALTAQLREQLADEAGIPVSVLNLMPGLGYFARRDSWIFPELNGKETGPDVTCILTRNRKDRSFVGKGNATVHIPAGQERPLKGGRRGLIRAAGWRDRPGPVLVVMGHLSVLAATAANLAAVGRSPCGKERVVLLKQLFHSLPPERPIILVGGEDEKGNMGLLALNLANRLERPVSESTILSNAPVGLT